MSSLRFVQIAYIAVGEGQRRAFKKKKEDGTYDNKSTARVIDFWIITQAFP